MYKRQVQSFRRALSCAPGDAELRRELDEVLVLERRLQELRRERLAAAASASNSDVAEVNRCKAQLRCVTDPPTGNPMDDS